MTESLHDALSATPYAARVRVSANGLVGGECAGCGTRHWPQRSVCAQCGVGRVCSVPLATQGSVETWSRCWITVAGIEPPYIIGLVKLDGVSVYGHLRNVPDDLHAGALVRVQVDLSATPAYWFEASEVSEGPRT